MSNSAWSLFWMSANFKPSAIHRLTSRFCASSMFMVYSAVFWKEMRCRCNRISWVLRGRGDLRTITLFAFGTDAVGELCLGPGHQINFDLGPIPVVIADFLAASADRKQPTER